MKRYLRQAVALAALCGVAALGQSTDARSAGTSLAGGEFTCAGMAATIVGTNGPDVLYGTPGPDVIVGLGGDDEIYGDRFDDFICGGPGDDYIEGGGGENLIFGEEGHDVIDGGVAGLGGGLDDTGDELIALDGTSTADMDGGRGIDTCTGGTTTTNCEL